MAVDLGSLIEEMGRRVYTLEQRITSPEYVVPNGSSPTFAEVKIGVPGEPPEAVISLDVAPATGLVLAPASAGQEVGFTATWESSETATQYEVQYHLRDLNSATYTLMDSRRTAGTSYTVMGLLPGRTYGVKVFAVGNLGNYSDPIPATGLQDVVIGTDATIPGTLTGLVAVAGTGSLTLMWDESTDEDVRLGGVYQVQISLSADYSSPIYDQETTSSIVSFTGLTDGVVHYSRVRGIDGSRNEGPWSPFPARTPTEAGGTFTGPVTGDMIEDGAIDDNHIVTAGLSAATIKFGTMSGDRIAAKTLDVNALETSTLTATTITLGANGRIVGGTDPTVATTPTGFLLNSGGFQLLREGTPTVSFDALTGNATFKGDITGASGTFNGNLSGSVITGGTFQTTSDPMESRVYAYSDGLNVQIKAATNYLNDPTGPGLTTAWNYNGTPTTGLTATEYPLTEADARTTGLNYGIDGNSVGISYAKSTTATGTTNIMQAVTLPAGTYVASVWARQSSSAGTVMSIRVQNWAGGVLHSEWTQTPQSGNSNTGWKRLYISGFVPSGMDFTRFILQMTGSSTAVTYIRWVAAQLEVGTTPGPFVGQGQPGAVGTYDGVSSYSYARPLTDLFNVSYADPTSNVFRGKFIGEMQSIDNITARPYLRMGGSALYFIPARPATSTTLDPTIPAHTAHMTRHYVQTVGALASSYISSYVIENGYWAGTHSQADFSRLELTRATGSPGSGRATLQGGTQAELQVRNIQSNGGSYTYQLYLNKAGTLTHVGANHQSMTTVLDLGFGYIDVSQGVLFFNNGGTTGTAGRGAGIGAGNGAGAGGIVYCAGTQPYSTRSIKSDIRTMDDDVLPRLRKVKPVRYKQKNSGFLKHEDPVRLSVIAEDIEEHLPEAAGYLEIRDENGNMKQMGLTGYNSTAMTAIHQKAIIELADMVDSLREEIKTLRKMVQPA
jgi:hypothetical protein